MRKKPVTKEYSYCAGLGKCITIVQLSDLHNCVFKNDNEALTESVKACNPDLIVFTGDMFNKRDINTEKALSICWKMSCIAPCYYSLGNHELRYSSRFGLKFEEYCDKLRAFGIRLLTDESEIVEVAEKSIEIGGFNADETAYAHFSEIPFFNNIPSRKNKEIPGILLSHNPELYESYEASDWDIILAGHLHGGIVRIPGIGGCVSPSGRLFPKYSGGFYDLKNNKKMLVSCGLGGHTIKIRIFNPPELVKLTIN